jgi:alkanesulfonate monooxygenase SsuD/methylene tetrahydromethanopterin reductase-like flavin-dependent oxidoreductase (luciferase family)
MSPVTFRLPGPLAIQVAQLDQMSDGRIELGLGAGWYEAEHSAYGIPFPGVGERFDRLEEQLAIITGLWSTPEDRDFTFVGQHYSLQDAPALPKPVQAHVPILIGGDGKRRTPQLAARYASEYNSNYDTVDDVAVRFARVRAACEHLGRPSHGLVLSTAHFLIVGSGAAEVRRRVDAMVDIWPGSTADLVAGSSRSSTDRSRHGLVDPGSRGCDARPTFCYWDPSLGPDRLLHSRDPRRHHLMTQGDITS